MFSKTYKFIKPKFIKRWYTFKIRRVYHHFKKMAKKKLKSKTHLIAVEDLLKVIKLVAISGYLKNYKPLSLILVSKVGNGKTEIISSFCAKNIVFLTDLSSTGVYNLMKNEHLTHIIIADFTKITMKNKQTSNNLMTTLNSAMEEGLHKQELKNTSIDMKGRNIGLITSTTKASYGQNKQTMEDFGFTSRMIVVSYDYGEKTFNDIMESIYRSEYLNNQYKPMPLIKGKISKKTIEIPYDLAKKLNKMNDNAFRTQKQLQTLACCNALYNKRQKVTEEDIEEIIKLSKFFNLKYTQI